MILSMMYTPSICKQATITLPRPNSQYSVLQQHPLIPTGDCRLIGHVICVVFRGRLWVGVMYVREE